jgi:AcrR family transcriptional regulator
MCMVKTSQRQLSRSDWLAAALKALEKGGLGAVKVLPLAAALGVSRGSFYWHFRNHDDLVDSVLAYWDTEFNDAVIERSLSASEDAHERLRSLFEDVVKHRRGRFDPAIRAWALHDRRATAVVRRVDRKRMAHIVRLFRDLGFSAVQAEARARLALAYFVGDHVILVNEPPAKRRKLLQLRYELLTQR